MSNIILKDSPITSVESDLFNIDTYAYAIYEFIISSDTPLTISIQGEWGSGKTSLMNLIGNKLSSVNEQKNYQIIKINTWEYFINENDNALSKFILSLIQEIINYSNQDKLTKEIKNIQRYAKMLATMSMKTFANDFYEGLKDIVLEDDSITLIKNLKSCISELIVNDKYNNYLEKNYVFFIDDLDRIDPETAIKVLELLKNIFDIKNCIFILAIDYNIIIRGLKKKYEKYTDSYISFKDYFDKIIQLPFVMPIKSYKINNMLMNGLIEIGYFKKNELSVDNVMNLVNAVYLSIGNNPRKVKRLLNTVKLSFLLDRRNESLLVRSDWKLINIILLCIQQEFSYIYNFLLVEPDYTKWSDKLFSSYVFDFNQEQFLKENIIYREEWLTFIHKMCLNNSILKNYAYNICKIFTIMNSFIKNDVGYQLSKILSLSESTNIDFVDITYNGYEYNNNSFTQFIQGNRLISEISLNDEEKVLDIGCGNGLITIDLFQKNTTISIDAIDISQSQIEIANKNRKSRSISSNSINFQVLNIFDLNKTNYYDLIFSNASMHWILDYNKAYHLIYNALKKGGRIAIQQGGKDCYIGLHNIVKLAYQNLKLDDYYFNWTFPVFYPTANEMKIILQNIGFTNVEVFSEIYDGKNYDSLPQDFANASLLYYYSRIPKKYHNLLKTEFLRLCDSQNLDLYTHRLFIYANKK